MRNLSKAMTYRENNIRTPNETSWRTLEKTWYLYAFYENFLLTKARLLRSIEELNLSCSLLGDDTFDHCFEKSIAWSLGCDLAKY